MTGIIGRLSRALTSWLDAHLGPTFERPRSGSTAGSLTVSSLRIEDAQAVVCGSGSPQSLAMLSTGSHPVRGLHVIRVGRVVHINLLVGPLAMQVVGLTRCDTTLPQDTSYESKGREHGKPGND
jgi:hypothetical protein